MLSRLGVSNRCDVSGVSWQVYGAPNSVPSTSSSDTLRLMWVQNGTVWKGPRLLLAIPHGHCAQVEQRIMQ